MAPRNTKNGASAKTRGTSTSRGGTSTSRRSTTKPSTRTAARSNRRGSSTTRSKSSASRRSPARSGQGTSGLGFFVARGWTFPLGIGLALAIFAWGYYPVAAVQYRESRERARLAAELEAIQERNERLRAEVDRLKTPAGVEDYARSQLGMVKKGENVVVVVDDQDQRDATETAGGPEIDGALDYEDPAGPWTALLDLIFGIE